MTESARKNSNKLPLKSYLLYLCIALFLTTGVTFSKYVTTTHTSDTARVVQFGELSLYETAEGEQKYNQNYIYAPGVNITKNPSVDFSKNELSAYVFVTVSAKDWVYNPSSHSYTVDNVLDWSVDTSRWAYLTHDAQTNQAVYYKLVRAGEQLKAAPIITDNTITVSPELKNSDLNLIAESTRSISFKAYAVQANGFENATDAWNALTQN